MNNEHQDIFDRLMSLPFFRIFQGFYIKYKAILLYLLFGGMTTIVSIGTFVLFDSVFLCHTLVANLISWFFAVLFAYITNRIWVFRSSAKGSKQVVEIFNFYAGRLVTLCIEELILLVFVTWLNMGSTKIKILAQIVVLILNYIISKLVVFRKETV